MRRVHLEREPPTITAETIFSGELFSKELLLGFITELRIRDTQGRSAIVGSTGRSFANGPKSLLPREVGSAVGRSKDGQGRFAERARDEQDGAPLGLPQGGRTIDPG